MVRPARIRRGVPPDRGVLYSSVNSGGPLHITGVLYGVDVKVFVSDERIPVFIKSLDLLNINGIQSDFDQLSERISSMT